MQPVPYEELDEPHLLALLIWREAANQGMLGRRGVGCNARNRVNAHWLGDKTYHSVILHPYQYSSFNAPPRTHITDPNESKWWTDGEQSWVQCLAEANYVLSGCDDVTNGSRFYFSPPVKVPPTQWGAVVPTASIGNLSFWKPAPADLGNQGDL